MKKRIAKVFVTTVLISSLIVSPVFATPSVDDMQEDKAQTQSEVAELQKLLTENLEKINNLEEEITQKEEEINKDDKYLDKIKAINPLEMSPMDALNFLYRLKEEMKKEECENQ